MDSIQESISTAVKMQKLTVKAVEFIDTLQHVLKRALGRNANFKIFDFTTDADTSITLNIATDRPGLPLIRSEQEHDNPVLFLYLTYVVGFDHSSKYLRVEESSISLQVKVKDNKNAAPLIRVEYEREKKHAAPAHMHIHANSPELAWLFGIAGISAPDFHALHFPMGGQRFRPTLEEFLFFLDDEKIFTNWHDRHWRTHLEKTLFEWERIQTCSAVRRHPEAVAEELRDLYYIVTPSEQTTS